VIVSHATGGAWQHDNLLRADERASRSATTLSPSRMPRWRNPCVVGAPRSAPARLSSWC